MFKEKDSDGIYLNEQNYLLPQQLFKMPLSFRSVYILFSLIGFSEKDIAIILNIDTIKVRERLARATHIMKDV